MMHFTMMAIELVRGLLSGDEAEREAAELQVELALETLEATLRNVLPKPVADDLFTAQRAQVRGNLSGFVIGVTISAIIGVAVGIPVINDVVANSNATGTTKTILDLLDLFIGLLILVAIAAPLMSR